MSRRPISVRELGLAAAVLAALAAACSGLCCRGGTGPPEDANATNARVKRTAPATTQPQGSLRILRAEQKNPNQLMLEIRALRQSSSSYAAVVCWGYVEMRLKPEDTLGEQQIPRIGKVAIGYPNKVGPSEGAITMPAGASRPLIHVTRWPAVCIPFRIAGESTEGGILEVVPQRIAHGSLTLHLELQAFRDPAKAREFPIKAGQPRPQFVYLVDWPWAKPKGANIYAPVAGPVPIK